MEASKGSFFAFSFVRLCDAIGHNHSVVFGCVRAVPLDHSVGGECGILHCVESSLSSVAASYEYELSLRCSPYRKTEARARALGVAAFCSDTQSCNPFPV